MSELLYRSVAEAAPGDDPFEYVMSDASVDRYGDVIDSDGWQLANFRKNSIALFNHAADAVIGHWRDVRVDNETRQLRGRLALAEAGTSPVVDAVRALVRQGILRAVSVGFRALKKEPVDAEKPYGAQRFLKSELVECSLVSVPANPNAVQIARSLGLSADTSALLFRASPPTRKNGRRPAAHGKPAEMQDETDLPTSYPPGFFVSTDRDFKP